MEKTLSFKARQVQAVDVSNKTINRAMSRLKEYGKLHSSVTNGKNLSPFETDTFESGIILVAFLSTRQVERFASNRSNKDETVWRKIGTYVEKRPNNLIVD